MPPAAKADAAALADDGRSTDIERELTKRFRVKFEYMRKVPASRFNEAASYDNQVRLKPIKPELVAEYRAALLRNDEFPPVVGYLDDDGLIIILDGNHRLASHKAEHVPLNVYLVDGATHPATLARIAMRANSRHGEKLSQAEKLESALYLVSLGAKPQAAADDMDIDVNVVKRSVLARAADDRALEAGIKPDQWRSVHSSKRGRLQQVATLEGFKDLFDLVYEADLDFEQVSEIVTQVNSTTKAATQQEIIAAHRDVLIPQIQAGGGGILTTTRSKGKRPPAAQLGSAVGMIMSVPDNDDAIVTAIRDPGEKKRTAIRYRDVAVRLGRLAGKLDPPEPE